MAAAKFERTGSVLRNAWPHVKHFANEQSATFVQSANESSSFVRKNSRKAEAAAGAAGCSSAGRSSCSSSSNTFEPKKVRAPRLRLGGRPLTAEFLNNPPQARNLSTAACATPKPFNSSLAAALLPDQLHATGRSPTAPKEEKPKNGASIDDLIKTASEKYDLNPDFWGKYRDIPSMAQASDKEDILQIIENFVLIHRKHVYLFQRLKNTILRSLDSWSAPDLATLCHAWAQLGFLHEDLCVAMGGRVTATAYSCNAQELCWLMDAYATARCSIQSVLDELTKCSLLILEDFTLPQLCLHASSFARLNIRHRALLESIAARLGTAASTSTARIPPPGLELEQHDHSVRPHYEYDCGSAWLLSARDLTLAAYSFAKLGFYSSQVFDSIAEQALSVVRDFTARDLQMIMVAFVRAGHWEPDLFYALSLQAQRRIAQFSSESLALILRAMAVCNMGDNPLWSRVVAQLPRAILTFRPADVTMLLNSFAAVQVHSLALFDIVTPFILEKAPFFTPSDWVSALRGYSSLGHRDTTFLSALGLHLEVSKLSLQQLCMAVVACSKLSFSGSLNLLAHATMARVAVEGAAYPVDVAGQLYTALLLLGHSRSDVSDEVVQALLVDLAGQLHNSATLNALSPLTCVNLCYAILMAPPMKSSSSHASSRHPVDAPALAERAAREVAALPGEGRLLLRPILRALKLLPWNRCALKSAQKLESLVTTCPGPPSAFLEAALNHVAPHLDNTEQFELQQQQQSGPATTPKTRLAQARDSSDSDSGAPSSADGAGHVPAGSGCRVGVFIANEIHEALSDISVTLAEVGVNHKLILDADTEVHISLKRSALLASTGLLLDDEPGQQKLALVWGSTVHYLSDTSRAVEPRLTPTARFQLAGLQAKGVEVVVVPHWWWSCHAATLERGRVLIQFLLTEIAKGAGLAIRA